MMRRLAAPAAVLALCAGVSSSPARAGDEASKAMKGQRFDLSSLLAPPIPKGPTLYVPSDGDADGNTTWYGEGSKYDVLFAFAEPPYPAHILSPDVVMDLLRRLVPEFNESGWSVRAAGNALQVRATEEGLKRVADAITFIRDVAAPRITATATLLAKDGGAMRTVATGSAALSPRRWTAVYFGKSVRRYAVDYNVEVAEEAETNDPVVAELPEGAELYLRYTPGESVSLVEAWSGAVDHLEPRTVDLSGIRNIPESNSMGKIEQPRIAVRRAYTCLALPSQAASSFELAWDGPGGPRTLKLQFGPAGAARAESAAGTHTLAILRAGALHAKLEGDTREPSLDDWIQGVKDDAGTAQETLSFESYAETFVTCEGPAAVLASARDALSKSESRLAGATVELRAVAVPEGLLREALEKGKASIGGVLSPEQQSAFVDAGGGAVASVRLPVVDGLQATFRSGVSETTLSGFDVEIAQRTGAMDPLVRSHFAGLAGTLRVSLDESGGAVVDFHGALSWVRPDATTIELPFRSPVGMGFNNNGAQGKAEDPTVRLVKLPLGGDGEARAGTSTSIPADAVKAGRTSILAVLSRGGGDGLPETVLLLVTVRK